jgi:hypothetical protein
VIIEVERAQRAVLKAMLKRPFRYPTASLYQEAGVLTVRQLFILKIATEKHKKVLDSTEHAQMLQKRVYRVQNMPQVRSFFAKRFDPYLSSFVYNRVTKKINIKDSSAFETKKCLKKWLTGLSYDETEKLLH